MKAIIVVGARPNFMKAAPILRAFDEARNDRSSGDIEYVLLHTGQHYDDNMSKVFFSELEMPPPDIDLGVGSGTQAEQTALIMVRFEKYCSENPPDLVVVVGDVNSTLACSITAVKLGVPVAHVEAGLRSYDRSMPEEINRVVTDALSEHLFTTSRDADENLKKEGIPSEKIHFVGNVMIDTLYRLLPKTSMSNIRARIGIENTPYVLVTFHRPSNVDDRENIKSILDALVKISEKIKVIFPVHPRTMSVITRLGAGFKGADGLKLTGPLGYLDFLSLMRDASLVVTDSGGIQEETTVLGVPCLTFRENTERPVTVTEGTNILVGTDPRKLVDEAFFVLQGKKKNGRIPELWDGKASCRIVRKILEIYGK